MLFSIRKYFLAFFIFFSAYSSGLAQAVVTVDQVKDACDGLFNGSVRITVTSGVENLSYFVIGTGFLQIESGPLDVGIPVTVSNLRPDTYFLQVADGDPAINFSTFFTINDHTAPTTIYVPLEPFHCRASLILARYGLLEHHTLFKFTHKS